MGRRSAALIDFMIELAWALDSILGFEIYPYAFPPLLSYEVEAVQDESVAVVESAMQPQQQPQWQPQQQPQRQPQQQQCSELRQSLSTLTLFSQLESMENPHEQVRLFNLKYSVADPAELLGRGTFGQVVVGVQPAARMSCKQPEVRGVAIKIFDYSDPRHNFKYTAALKEVAIFAALPSHRCILHLLDVLGTSQAIRLVFPRWDMCLRKFAQHGRVFEGRLLRN
jgi:hypothetical protein